MLIVPAPISTTRSFSRLARAMIRRLRRLARAAPGAVRRRLPMLARGSFPFLAGVLCWGRRAFWVVLPAFRRRALRPGLRHGHLAATQGRCRDRGPYEKATHRICPCQFAGSRKERRLLRSAQSRRGIQRRRSSRHDPRPAAHGRGPWRRRGCPTGGGRLALWRDVQHQADLSSVAMPMTLRRSLVRPRSCR